jgi:hypothetical protein
MTAGRFFIAAASFSRQLYLPEIGTQPLVPNQKEFDISGTRFYDENITEEGGGSV